VSPAACSSDGRGIVVSFNPDHDFSYDYKGKLGSGFGRVQGFFQATPQAIPLGHELGHAMRYAAGTHLPEMIPEETANMANENKFRAHLRLLLRKIY